MGDLVRLVIDRLLLFSDDLLKLFAATPATYQVLGALYQGLYIEDLCRNSDTTSPLYSFGTFSTTARFSLPGVRRQVLPTRYSPQELSTGTLYTRGSLYRGSLFSAGTLL